MRAGTNAERTGSRAEGSVSDAVASGLSRIPRELAHTPRSAPCSNGRERPSATGIGIAQRRSSRMHRPSERSAVAHPCGTSAPHGRPARAPPAVNTLKSRSVHRYFEPADTFVQILVCDAGALEIDVKP